MDEKELLRLKKNELAMLIQELRHTLDEKLAENRELRAELDEARRAAVRNEEILRILGEIKSYLSG